MKSPSGRHSIGGGVNPRERCNHVISARQGRHSINGVRKSPCDTFILPPRWGCTILSYITGVSTPAYVLSPLQGYIIFHSPLPRRLSSRKATGKATGRRAKLGKHRSVPTGNQRSLIAKRREKANGRVSGNLGID